MAEPDLGRHGSSCGEPIHRLGAQSCTYRGLSPPALGRTPWSRSCEETRTSLEQSADRHRQDRQGCPGRSQGSLARPRAAVGGPDQGERRHRNANGHRHYPPPRPRGWGKCRCRNRTLPCDAQEVPARNWSRMTPRPQRRRPEARTTERTRRHRAPEPCQRKSRLCRAFRRHSSDRGRGFDSPRLHHPQSAERAPHRWGAFRCGFRGRGRHPGGS